MKAVVVVMPEYLLPWWDICRRELGLFYNPALTHCPIHIQISVMLHLSVCLSFSDNKEDFKLNFTFSPSTFGGQVEHFIRENGWGRRGGVGWICENKVAVVESRKEECGEFRLVPSSRAAGWTTTTMPALPKWRGSPREMFANIIQKELERNEKDEQSATS